MSEPREEELLRIAEALADGLPVDWSGLRAREPAAGHELASLRAVEEVASAFRTVREAPDDEAAGEEP